MLSEYAKQLLVASAISDKIKKLEKKLEKEQIKLDKCIDNSMHLPARTGVRGGTNTKLMAKVDRQRERVNDLKEQIEFLKENKYMWGASRCLENSLKIYQ